MQDEALLYRKHHLYDGDICLPPVNREIGRMNRLISQVQSSDYVAETKAQMAPKHGSKKVTSIFELESQMDRDKIMRAPKTPKNRPCATAS